MSQELDISNIIKILGKEKKFFFTWLFIPTFLLAAYSMIMPQTYSSQTSILPPSKSSNGGLAGFLQSMSGGMSLGGLTGSSEVKIYGDILVSRSVADHIIRDLKLDTLKSFQTLTPSEKQEAVLKMYSVESLKSGMILITSYFKTDFMPNEKDQEAASDLSYQIANKAVEALNLILQKNTNSKAKQSRVYIEGELKKYRLDLDSVTHELELFQLENNVLSIEDQAKAIIDQAVSTGAELLKYQNELNLAKIQYGEQAPVIKTLEKQVQYLEEQVRKLQLEGMDGSEYSIPLKDVPTLTLKYADLFREKEILEQVLLYLETQKHQEAIEENKDVIVIQTLDEAQKPQKRSSPKRTQLIIIGLIFFSILSSILTIYKAYRKGHLISG